MMKILPSVASADPLHLAGEIDRLKGWPDLHFDIEDGNFTPNLTHGQKTLEAVSAYIVPRKLDVHLMVSEPLAWLPVIEKCSASSVCAHLEALRFPLLFLNGARERGMKAGLALNLGTPWQAVLPFADCMDYLLVMTSEPDARGEHLNAKAYDKALEAAASLPLPVYADGGLTVEKAIGLLHAGASGCVLGRAVFQAEDPAALLCMIQNESN